MSVVANSGVDCTAACNASPIIRRGSLQERSYGLVFLGRMDVGSSSLRESEQRVSALVLELGDSGDSVERPRMDSAVDSVSCPSPLTMSESVDLRHWLAPVFEGQQYRATISEA